MKAPISLGAILSALVAAHPDPGLLAKPSILIEPSTDPDWISGPSMGKAFNRIGPGRPSLCKNWPGHRNRRWVPMGGAQECARRAGKP